MERITDQLAKTEDKNRKIKTYNVYHRLCVILSYEISLAEDQESFPNSYIAVSLGVMPLQFTVVMPTEIYTQRSLSAGPTCL